MSARERGRSGCHFAAGSVPLFVLLLVALAVSAQAQTGGTWQSLAPMPTARQELATAVLNGKIYVIAGLNTEGQSTARVDVYNPNTNTWARVRDLPTATNHNSAAVASGRLFVFGAFGNLTYAYDPVSDSWLTVAPSFFGHGATAAVGVINEKIYVAGGSGGTEREVEVYDPVANSWTRLADMNVARNHTAGGVLGGKFYVVGGRGSAEASTALEVYDPQTNIWSTRAPMPTGRSGIAAAAVNGELWVFGGEVPGLHGEVEAYNPASNTWRKLPNMPMPRHGIWAAVIGDKSICPAARMRRITARRTSTAFSPSTAGRPSRTFRPA